MNSKPTVSNEAVEKLHRQARILAKAFNAEVTKFRHNQKATDADVAAGIFVFLNALDAELPVVARLLKGNENTVGKLNTGDAT